MGETKYVIAGSLIDGSGGDVQKNMCLAIENSRIRSIMPSSQTAEIHLRQAVDLSHCTLLPPLVDCFVKLSQSSAADTRIRSRQQQATWDEAASLIRQNLHYNHSHGVLGLANYDDARGSVAEFLQQEESKDILIANSASHLPQLFEFMANGATPGRSCEGQGWGAAAFSAEIGSLITGPKNDTSDSVKNTGASGGDKVTVALANGVRALTAALDSGCNAVLQGHGMTEHLLERMASEGVVWIPNLIRVKRLVEDTSGHSKKLAARYLNDHLRRLRQAKKYGVEVALGTGAGCSSIIHGESVVEEIKLLIKAGYSLVEALHCSSTVGAVLLGLKDIGLLQKGKVATFLVTRGMTVQLPRKLSYLEAMYVRGEPSRWYRKNPVKTVYRR